MLGDRERLRARSTCGSSTSCATTRPSGAEDAGQPGLLDVLDRIDSGEASCLIVSDLECLTREDGAARDDARPARAGQTRLVALDVGLDSASEPGGLRDGRAGRGAEDARRAAARAGAQAAPARPPCARSATRPRLRTRASAAPSSSEQRLAIERYCARHGIEVVEIVREREPKDGKALDRAGLSFLIERIAAGDASCLVVTGLQRLSRSVAELGTIVQWLERNEVRLDRGRARPRHRRPGRPYDRTRARLGRGHGARTPVRAHTQGPRGGARQAPARRARRGRDWDAIRKRIAKMRADGMTLQAIADTLNKEGVPTQRGGTKWRPSSVQTAAGYKRPSRSSRVSDLPAVRKRSPKRP